MVDYPKEWEKYLIPNERKFVKDTPADIISKAKDLNKDYIAISGTPFFVFEDEEGWKHEERHNHRV